MRARSAVVATLVLVVAAFAGQVSTAVIKSSFIAPRVEVASATGACQIYMSAGTRPVVFDVAAGVWVPPRPIYVLVDPAYPILGTTRSAAKGLYDHLHDKLAAAGWSMPVTMVNSTQAADVLDRSDSILVVDAGAMPDVLLGGTGLSRLTSFMNRGGELIYVGDGLLYWSSQRGEARITGSSDGRLGWAGEHTLLGANLVHSTSGPDASSALLGTSPSTSAAWLGISYQRAGRGALITSLTALGGWDLGIDSTEPPLRTSLAVVPVQGTGRLVLFGSTLSSSETQVSNDIARVLLSGSDVAPPLAHLRQRVGHEDNATSSVGPDASASTVPNSGPVAPNSGPIVPTAMRLLAYDSQGFDYFSQTLQCSGGVSPGGTPTTTITPASPKP